MSFSGLVLLDPERAECLYSSMGGTLGCVLFSDCEGVLFNVTCVYLSFFCLFKWS